MREFVNAERVSLNSWVGGADEGDGGEMLEEKEVIDQRTIQSSLAALERMRSPCQHILVVLVEWE